MLAQLRQFTRSQRGQRFRAYVREMRWPLRILDLGGTVRFWEAWDIGSQQDVVVTLINNHAVDPTNRGVVSSCKNIIDVNADVTAITVDYMRRFDLVFSNSVIEHLPSAAEQVAVAGTISASGRAYFIQTPNKYAPIDPHFPRPYVPFFAAYPRHLQARLLTWTDLGSGWRSPNMEMSLTRMASYLPLSVADVRALFPDAEIVMEPPMGVPMSILAYRR
jgi:hypothetical protein